MAKRLVINMQCPVIVVLRENTVQDYGHRTE